MAKTLEFDAKINATELDEKLKKIKQDFERAGKAFGESFTKFKGASAAPMQKLTNNLMAQAKKGQKIGQEFGKRINRGMKIGLLAAGGGMVKFVKDSIEAAGDLGEAENVVDVVFKKMSKDMKKWTTQNSLSYGLAKKDALEYAGKFGALAQGMGISQKKSAEMAKKLIATMGDTGSFFNKSNEEVNTALEGIFTGQTKALMKFGVNAKVAQMETFLASKGINKAWKSLDQGEQAIYRYQYVMGKLKVTHNDFKRTASFSLPNSLKILKGTWENMLTAFGKQGVSVQTKLMSKLAKEALKLDNWLNSKKGKNAMKHFFHEVERYMNIFIEGAKNLFTWLSKHTNEIKGIIKLIILMKAKTAAVKVAQLALYGTIKLIKAAQLAINVIMGIGKGLVIAFNFLWAINPIGAIVTAITLVVAGIVMAMKHSKSFSGIWTTIKQIIGGVFGVIKGIMDAGKWVWDKITGGGGKTKKHASGGAIGSADTHIWGEAGAEFMVNAGNGQILNMHEIKKALAGAGGGGNVYIDGEMVGSSLSRRVSRNGTTDLYYG